MIDSLSRREIENVLLISQVTSNQAISGQLYLAADTVKGHNRLIFYKVDAQSRPKAIARALNLMS